MRAMLLVALVALSGLARASRVSQATQVSPITKVLEMLGDMKVKGEEAKDKEHRTFAKYAEWCDDQEKDLGYEMKTAQKNSEELAAFIEKADSEVTQLGQEIEELDGEIARLEGDVRDGQDIRKTEKADYLKVSGDYSESVDAIDRAITTLSAQSGSTPQAEAMLQRMAVTVPGMKGVLSAFLQAKEEGAPAVAALDSQSGGIVDMLQALQKKFKKELATVDEEESNKAHHHDLAMLHLSDTIEKSKEDRDEKQSTKGKTTAQSAEAKGQLEETKSDIAENEKFLSDMGTTLRTKKSTFEANQKVRQEEIDAIAKAVEIVSSVALPQVSQGQVMSLLQTQSAQQRVAARDKASSYLQQRAAALSSNTLQALAKQMASNPFAKVTNMIKDLIAKLKDEAAAEGEHKAWCDEELKNNKMKRDKKQSKVDTLSAEREDLTGKIATMSKEIAEYSKNQADLTKAMQEAADMRASSKAENEEAIRDAQTGSEAVKQALVVLREFYAKQASFLQGGAQAPEMAAYKGMGSGGIVGMLEVIQTDFLRVEADTKADEASSQREFDGFMKDSGDAKKSKHDSEVETKLARDQAEFDIGEAKKDLNANFKELDKATKYYENLKPQCLEVHVSYEERVARRKEEIESLKNTYGILDGKM